MKEKILPLKDAIARFVVADSSVVLGAVLEPDVPFAATHEIIRQGIKGLNVIAPISDASTDMLIGAGCCNEVTGAWVGNVSGGLGHNYRRAFEASDTATVKLHDHSNFSIAMALMAGAYGMPYAPMRSILGSDISKSNPDMMITENPFSEDKEPIILVPPLVPDVAIIVVQRADVFGNNHHWGSRGVVQEAALAAENVIVLANEIVEPAVIASDPSRVLVPGYLVSAVCHVPAASHPSPQTGCWKRDNTFFGDYHAESRTVEGFDKWLQEWIFGVEDHAAYCQKLGSQLEDLRITGSNLAAPTNYAAG
ncbi:MAG: CoA transferase subunit A [Rhodospirillaceae bacterium]|jgi:glutaconate CoA-transferase, subunit A|nr:CoA transferase subunit A [Rhodospirillaceae bacterium]MBT5243836.1 CoA transferase subunit A [Rhodospirillaceae bacterium]MBT5562885.1 CoA transferase subunit A [Rhodospirillaceae bacterium]MBT6241284.1 CoA transferase subunit A [Rhodospirillaceae bacterium]MBT7138753.1 CoA transferase subunit A [Rhodospirillaceae bacterium]